ncbi:MAG TPA: response regulator [Chthonomonadales bacterium]|nr:response regulator [Chthonomonadales bacterium]
MTRILVIDDERNIRMMIRLALEHVGYVVETAIDGDDGLRHFGSGAAWDLVLLDQRMPGRAGLEVLHEIRARDPEARVVVITAFGTVDLAVQAMKLGASDFLRKPFTADVLRGAVSAALAKGRSRFPAPVEATPITYAMTTLNGYLIEHTGSPGASTEEGYRCTFDVVSPLGERRACTVLVPTYVQELVKAQADRETLPGGEQFWVAFCESVVANHVWQHRDFPSDEPMRVDDLTSAQRRWIEEVMAANEGG